MFNASKSRKIFIAMMTLMSLISTVSAVDTYQMVWSDEFDGNGLDSTKWQKEVNCNGGGNNELQCYTDRDSNVEVSGGYLKITAKPENYNGRSYTSGRINTKGKASWKYGKFDIRAKLPKGDYLWPAIWMLPRDNVYGGWAASGEIDIMEARGQNNNRISTALHYGGAWPNNVYKGSGDVTFGFDFTADFHVFTCIWEEDQIQFLVDGKVFHTMNLNQSWYSGKGTNPYNANRQPFDQPFYFLLNLAIGGGFFGSESNSLTVQTAQNWASPQLIIDYVRVYQKMKTSGIVPPPAPVPSSSTPSLPVATKEAVCVNKCNGQSCCNDQKLGVVCYNPASYGCPIDISTGKNSLCGGGLKACGGVCFDGDRYDCTISGLVQKEEIISSIIDNTPTIIVPLTEDSSEGETLIEATRTQPNNVIQGNGGKNLVLSLFAVVLGLLLVL